MRVAHRPDEGVICAKRSQPISGWSISARRGSLSSQELWLRDMITVRGGPIKQLTQ